MKTKIEIKSIFGKLLFEFECENNSISKTVSEALKNSANLRYADLRYADLRYADLSYANLSYANLSYANLSSADLRYADLSYADLSYANLSYANLRYADLSSADLSYADLRYADLSYANLSSADLRYANLSSANLSSANLRYANLRSAITDKRYVSISGIGREKRMTTYCVEDNKIWCGCFTGTLQEFERKILDTHKENKQHLIDYVNAVLFFKTFIKP